MNEETKPSTTTDAVTEQDKGRCALAPGSESLITAMLESQPQIGARERHNIRRALDAGRAYGYGNVMAWLATEWAVNLRDAHGLSEETAIMAVSNRGPYPLPPNHEDAYIKNRTGLQKE